MRVVLAVSGHLLGALALVVAWLLAMLGLVGLLRWPTWTALIPISLFIGMWFWLGTNRWIVGAALLALAVMLVWRGALRPRHDLDWEVESSVLPRVEIEDGLITIHDLRNFSWKEDGSVEPIWETQRYELDQLNQLDLFFVPLDGRGLVAHTMLGFGFEDGRHLVVSVEARREKGEEYGLVTGELNQFELIYLFGTEEDLLTTRAVTRGNRIDYYPLRATPEFIQSLFLSFADSANRLREQPEFYSSITNNCTVAIVRHVDAQPGMKKPIGIRLGTLLPGQSARLLHRLGLIDTELDFAEARKAARIDDRIKSAAGKPGFSQAIRTAAR